jgi:hypothetical protein
VVLFDGLTGVRFSACPRFTPTLSFRHIGLTGDLIYIKSRRLDFFLFFPSRLPPCAAVVHRTARGLAAAASSVRCTPTRAAVVHRTARGLAAAASSVRRTPTHAAASPPCRRTGLRRAPTRTAIPCLAATAAASPSCHRAVPRRRHAVPPPHLRATAPSCAAVTPCRRHCTTATTTPLLHCPPSPLSSKAAAIVPCRRAPLPGHSRFCVTASSRATVAGTLKPASWVATRERGKEQVVEPPKQKKTRAQKEVECAAMAARATDDQAAGRGRQFQIREPGARTEEQ